LKPAGYFRRFRSSIQEIIDSIDTRCRHGRWHPALPRARQRQWWHRLGRMIFLILGISYVGSRLQAFNLLFKQHFIPVSSTGQMENTTMN
jgi:hypothetical protein